MQTTKPTTSRTDRLQIRVTPAEKACLVAAAARGGEDPQALVRRAALLATHGVVVPSVTVPADAGRTALMNPRVTAAQKTRLVAHAAARGVGLSTFVRGAALAEAHRILAAREPR